VKRFRKPATAYAPTLVAMGPDDEVNQLQPQTVKKQKAIRIAQ